MRFTVDSRVYSVIIAARPIVREGEPRLGWCDTVGRRIYLSDELARGDRERVLRHEIRHAWTAAKGLKDSNEADAEDVSAFVEWFDQELAAHGGAAALEALDPPPDSIPTGSVGRPILNQCACGNCDATVALGSVHSDPSKWNEVVGCWTMQRGMLCPVCDRVTVWCETCSEAGQPLGAFLNVPPPTVLKGEAAIAWQRGHQDVCRIAMV